MDEAGAAPETRRPPFGGVRAWSAEHPVALAAIAYGLVALAAAVTAFFVLFNQVAFYDDEGTLLIAVRAFADGQVLYRDIYAAYGPFFFDVFGGFFALTGIAVTNDASRLVVGVVWVLSSIGFGVAAQRLSGRLALGLAAMIVAFGTLGVLSAEPMHPQVAIAPLLAGITLMVAFGPTRRVGWAGAVFGALLGCLVLTKVNVGGYAVVAAAVAAFLTWEPLQSRRWLRWPVLAGLLVLPVFIMYPDLREEWVRQLAALEVLTLAAVAIAAHSARPGAGESSATLRRWLLAAVAGGAVALVAILALLVLTGPSVSQAYDGIVTQGLKLRSVFMIPLVLPSAAVDWGILAVAAAGLAVWLRRDGAGSPLVPGLFRIGAGIAIWFTVAGVGPFSFGPGGNYIILPMALAWVAALAPAGVAEDSYRRYARVFLPLLAICQTLQVYPVAGSQIRIAAVSFVAVGVVCIADGIGQLRAWSAASGWEAPRFEAASTAAALAIAALFGYHAIVSTAATGAIAYHDNEKLPFHGAEMLHLAQPQNEEFVRLVDLIHEHDCTAFIGFPNVDSLYLWSGVEPPKPNPPGAWPIVLPLDQQQRVVDEMRASPRPCAMRNDGLAEGAWLHGTPPDESDPLVNYIFNDFKTVDEVGEYKFMVAK
ncbi:MAG TPA: hypothetical protein VG816_05660 [Solirubrobacterales bacterium]|nr:hypothetical protein [Solirubrobacterales bacterium]